MAMGLFKFRGVLLLLGIALLLEAVRSVQEITLEATALYDTQGACADTSVAPVLVTAIQSYGCVESANRRRRKESRCFLVRFARLQMAPAIASSPR